ncbi:MAG: hypothetical protein R2939_07170 [Kofleriaceae bacterium]
MLDDPALAARHLDLGDRHPLAPGLRRALAVALGDRRILDGAQASIERQPAGAAREVALWELASTWLHGFGDAERAKASVAAALAGAAAPGPDTLALATMVWACAGDHAALAQALLAAATTASAPPLAMVADGAAVLLDQLGDAAAALALTSSALAAHGGAPVDVAGLRVIDLGLEAALRLGDARAPGLAALRARAVRRPGRRSTPRSRPRRSRRSRRRCARTIRRRRASPTRSPRWRSPPTAPRSAAGSRSAGDRRRRSRGGAGGA